MRGVNGVHHITAIAGPAQENLDFHAAVLGMRLVKRSVNQDDPSTYHLFYADAEGHPGSALTFFPWAEITVHDLAWRVDDEAHQTQVRSRVETAGVQATPMIERFWFTSVYFKEPGGVLFELATDGPGFAIDEDAAHLGETLVLPPWLEAHRGSIEQALPPLAFKGEYP